LMIICVLKGAKKFHSDLTGCIDSLNSNNGQSVPFKEDFLRAKSYTGDKSSGNVRLTMADFKDLEGKHILLVEDIVDSGETMKMILPALRQHKPASLKVASLLVKDVPKVDNYLPDYAGFIIPPVFVVGYCLDYNEHFRDLSHICIINEHGKEKYKQ